MAKRQKEAGTNQTLDVNAEMRYSNRQEEGASVENSGHTNHSIVEEASKIRPDIRKLQNLLLILEEDFSPVQEKMLLLKGKITFDLLWCLFPPGSDIIFKHEDSGLNCGGKVYLKFIICPCSQQIISTGYGLDPMSGQNFSIWIRCIDYNGSTFHYAFQRMYFLLHTLLNLAQFRISMVSEKLALWRHSHSPKAQSRNGLKSGVKSS